MVKIRLSQTGAKHQRQYRLVAINSQAKRDGKNLEVLGFYQPNQKPPFLKIKPKRIKYWLEKGAQMSPTVRKILADEKIS